MSVMFVLDWLRGKVAVTQPVIQQLLEENDKLFPCIMGHQNKDGSNDCIQHQCLMGIELLCLL
uniref:SS18 N-terminal domain-containing protein n=1 Tax=Moschus moschiferus TaxID=68415 RepID=A0A8C6E172_MOSMO